MTEEERYTTIQAQMAEISDQATTNPNPAKSMLSAMLLAEVHERNERHHRRILEARREFVGTLEVRIEQLKLIRTGKKWV